MKKRYISSLVIIVFISICSLLLLEHKKEMVRRNPMFSGIKGDFRSIRDAVYEAYADNKEINPGDDLSEILGKGYYSKRVLVDHWGNKFHMNDHYEVVSAGLDARFNTADDLRFYVGSFEQWQEMGGEQYQPDYNSDNLIMDEMYYLRFSRWGNKVVFWKGINWKEIRKELSRQGKPNESEE